MATKKRPTRKAKKKAAAVTRRSKQVAPVASSRAQDPSLQEGTPAESGSFSLHGPLAATKSPSALETAAAPLADEVSIRVKQEFRPAERGIAEDAAANIETDDVIELEFADGTCTWMRADEYRERFASPFVAAERGYIDDVIEPRETRPRLIRALRMLENKVDTMPRKKHGNIPL